MSKVYEPGYPGVYTMQWHDKDDDLRRWFGNYAESKYGIHLGDCEWLTIEEVRDGKVTRYVGTIGADHTEHRRTVKFEVGAPPPPTFMRKALRAYVPPPPEPEWVRRKREDEFYRDMMMRHRMIDRMLADRPRVTVPAPPPRYRLNG